MEPLVSICIPAFNAERFIVETIESALAQTYPKLEIIVSDDASTDRTAPLVEQYMNRSVRFLKHPKNLGMHANWNAVIRTSSGKYILKLDADDIVEPGYVAEQVKVMEEYPEVVFAHCACRLIDVDGRFLGYERSIQGSFIRSGLEEWPRYVSGPRVVNIVMLRRSAYDRVGGYDERYFYSGDWAMHRALLLIGSVFYNDRILATYRVHNMGKAGIKRLQARERLMHLEDMERNWPDAVPHKAELLQRARKRLAIQTILSASRCSPQERSEILSLIPDYTDSRDVKLLALFLQYGGAGLARLYLSARQKLRLLAKAVVFRSRQGSNSLRYKENV